MYVKKVNGRKRHILVDGMGNLLKVIAHAANLGECDGAKRLLLRLPEPLWTRLEKILADGGHEGASSKPGSSKPVRLIWRFPSDHAASKVLLSCRSGEWLKELSLGWGVTAVSATITNT